MRRADVTLRGDSAPCRDELATRRVERESEATDTPWSAGEKLRLAMVARFAAAFVPSR